MTKLTKMTKKYIEALILQEVHSATGAELEPVARKLAKAGIAKQPESVRRELMQLVAGLDPQNPEEIEQLGAMVAQLMDASRENIEGDYGLEEEDVPGSEGYETGIEAEKKEKEERERAAQKERVRQQGLSLAQPGPRGQMDQLTAKDRKSAERSQRARAARQAHANSPEGIRDAERRKSAERERWKRLEKMRVNEEELVKKIVYEEIETFLTARKAKK